jgi:hypothetical protein
MIRVTGGQASLPPQPNVLVWRGDDRLSSSIPPGKRRSTLCGYLAGGLVPRFQRSNAQIPGYQARTFPAARQRIAYPVQALGGSGKAFGCFLSFPGRAYTGRMVDKTYLVCFKPPSLALQHVDASRFEIHGEHLVFVDSLP